MGVLDAPLPSALPSGFVLSHYAEEDGVFVLCIPGVKKVSGPRPPDAANSWRGVGTVCIGSRHGAPRMSESEIFDGSVGGSLDGEKTRPTWNAS